MKNRTWPWLFALAPLAIFCTSTQAQSIYTPYAFTNFAGSDGGWGDSDGVGTNARFNNPFDVALDSATNLYVADGFNCTIRKITPIGGSWVVTTLAGSPRVPGSVDATNSVARFNTPTGVAVDAFGNVYVADQANATIRRVTPSGVVTTIAGSALQTGSKDATNDVARFNRPSGLALDAAGNIYVADSGNHTVRKITPVGTNWVVTTIAGVAGASGSFDGTNGTIRFGVFTYGPPSIAVDNVMNLYVADIGNSTIRKLTPVGTNWVASTLAGSAGNIGFNNGTNSDARFYNPYGVAVDNVGNLYVGDGDNLVRKITPLGTNWVVTTLAGDTAFGSVDGTGSAAEFNYPQGLRVDGAGNIYLVDGYNSTIRLITPATVVTTLAGTPFHQGSVEGIGAAAKFNLPFGVAVDSASNVYVGDQNNHTIRRITPAGVVSTLAGNPGTSGAPDGTNQNAYFRQPSDLAVDGAGNIYVADAGNYKIRRVSFVGGTNWAVTTLAGGTMIGSKDGTNKVATFANCYGLCIDAATNIYVADTYNHIIRRVSPQGTNWVVTTLAGTAGNIGSADGTNKNASFYYPYGVAVDPATNLYVADYDNQTIRKITPIGTNWVVTTIAGSANFFGSVDGTNSDARFLYPQGITIDPSGNLYVSDGGNATIRRLSKSGTNWVVTTLGGSPRSDGVGQSSVVDGIGSAARLNNTWVLP